MGVPKKAGPARLVPRVELEALTRAALQAASALKSTGVKKALPKASQAQQGEALEILRELEARGEIYRWAKGKVEWFFAWEPVGTLEKAARLALAPGPLPADVLQKRVSLETNIPKPCFDEWKKKAVARGDLFEVAGASSKSKYLALEPDVRIVLKKAIVELKKGLSALDVNGVRRERVAQILWEELGLPSAASPASNPDRDAFLEALRALAAEHPPGTLLPVGALRGRVSLDKVRFDGAALLLSRQGVIVLHHHDYPGGMAPAELRLLVQDDNGTSYVGVALKSP